MNLSEPIVQNVYKQRKREVRFTPKDLAKQTTSKVKSEWRFIGTPRCGMRAIGGWLFSQCSGLSFYHSKPIRQLSSSVEIMKQQILPALKSKTCLVARNKGSAIQLGYGLDGFYPSVALEFPYIYLHSVSIMVVRTPDNQLASLDKSLQTHGQNSLTARDYMGVRDLLAEHIRFYNQSPVLWDGQMIKIVFDLWATDEKYRRKILALDVLHPYLIEQPSPNLMKQYSDSSFGDLTVTTRQKQFQSHSVRTALRDNCLPKIKNF